MFDYYSPIFMACPLVKENLAAEFSAVTIALVEKFDSGNFRRQNFMDGIIKALPITAGLLLCLHEKLAEYVGPGYRPSGKIPKAICNHADEYGNHGYNAYYSAGGLLPGFAQVVIYESLNHGLCSSHILHEPLKAMANNLLSAHHVTMSAA